MVFNFKLWSFSKFKHLLVQLLLAALFLGLAFRLLFFGFYDFGSDLEADLIEGSEVARDPRSESGFSMDYAEAEDLAAPPVAVAAESRKPVGYRGAKPPVSDRIAESPISDYIGEGGNGTRIGGKCNLFVGEWVDDPSGPAYTNETCPFIEGHQNCMRNGRPDTAYLYWRWKPLNCELPRFDPRRFLNSMTNKAWGLIGDSISRNHVQSLLCMLSQVEQPIEIYHDEAYKSRKWLFPAHNFTIFVIWSPYLVQASIFEDENGVSSAEAELQLDKLDENWTDHYQDLHYITISSGKWFIKNAIYRENNSIIGCHSCENGNLTQIGFDYAYRKALRSALTFMATTRHEGLSFFRTSTPDHFEGGNWDNGGNCVRTAPVKEGEIELKEVHQYLRDVELSEFENAAKLAGENGVDLRLLDLMKLSLLRPDGHPGAYRHFQPFAKDTNVTLPNDCLHWCLPGPIDAWNDVIMEMMVDG